MMRQPGENTGACGMDSTRNPHRAPPRTLPLTKPAVVSFCEGDFLQTR
jgi:hypothetical protein